jgi:hypothetical protein
MVNPYYYFFYLFFLLLYPIAKDKRRVPFSIVSFMGIILMIHSGVILIMLKSYLGIQILPHMNKLLFGSVFTVIYFVINHYLFEKNDKYVELIGKIKEAPNYKKINSAILIILYFLLPLFLGLLLG